MSTILRDYPMDEALATAEVEASRTARKPSYPIHRPLSSYLARFRRELKLPVTYGRLEGFRESVPVADAAGRDTL